jgi:hypothetical protein
VINGNSNDYQYQFTESMMNANIKTLIINGDVFNRDSNYYLEFGWLSNSQIEETIINFDINEEEFYSGVCNCTSEILTFNGCANFNESSRVTGCPNLTTLNFKKGLKSAEACIHACDNLSTINIYLNEQNITDFCDYMIQPCPSLTTINIIGSSDCIKKGIINISSLAFYWLNDITINVPWSESETSNAPWGANNATVNYNCTF